MSFGGGFFGGGTTEKTTTGGATQSADNLGADVSGGGAIALNFQDNRKASGKYANNTGSGMPGEINIIQSDAGAIDAGKALGLSAIESGNLQTGKAFEVAAGVISAADRMHENNLVFTQSTIDDNANLFKWSQQQTAQTIDRAFASADKITRSDSTITSESLMKYGALAAVAVVAIIFMGKFVK